MLAPHQFGPYQLAYEPDEHHRITATHDDTPVGSLSWSRRTHRIVNVTVEPEHQRQGLASAMWEMGQAARPRPKHSPDRTDAGEAWARAVGGRLPRRLT